MAESYDVDRLAACKHSSISLDGAYICYLHFKTGAGIKHDRFDMGKDDPLTQGVGALAGELRNRLPHRYPVLKGEGKNVTLDRLIALSVVRTCLREGHGNPEAPEFPDIPRDEIAGYFAFAKNHNVFPARMLKGPSKRIGQIANMGTAELIDEPGRPIAHNVIYLPIPSGDNTYLMSGVVVAACSQGTLSGPYIGLHELVPVNLDEDVEPAGRTLEYLETVIKLAD